MQLLRDNLTLWTSDYPNADPANNPGDPETADGGESFIHFNGLNEDRISY